jgi:hypothetical protein
VSERLSAAELAELYDDEGTGADFEYDHGTLVRLVRRLAGMVRFAEAELTKIEAERGAALASAAAMREALFNVRAALVGPNAPHVKHIWDTCGAALAYNAGEALFERLRKAEAQCDSLAAETLEKP